METDIVQYAEELELPASLAELEHVQYWVDSRLRQAACSKELCGQIALVVEELFVNIAQYAYGEKDGKAHIRVLIAESSVTVQFADSGTAFNPCEATPPDVHAALETREIGGLGIFLVKQMVDELSYRRTDGKNYITARKNR